MAKVYYIEYTLRMTTPEAFSRIELSSRAARIYDALEASEPLLVTELSAHTDLYRPTLYRELAHLRKVGLVHTSLRGKRTVYSAAPRARVVELFEGATQRVHEYAQTDVRTTLADTREIRLTGPDGIRAAFDDVIDHTKRGDTFYRITSERDLDRVNSYLSPEYRARRDAKRLERLVITNATSGSRKRARLERFVRFMPDGAAFSQNIIELIYGNRVSFIDITEETVHILDNPRLADFHRVLFRQLYKKL